MKLICLCLLAVALLGCRGNAQEGSQNPQIPGYPRQPQKPINNPNKNIPSNPQQTQNPNQPPKQTQREPFQTCEVAENHKIQCGAPGITVSECGAINCCFDGRTCYYGKSVTLQCTKDGQFIVVVARDATLPNIDLNSISFYRNDLNCNPVDTTSAFAIYQFPVTACGTVVTEEPDVLMYENKMSSLYEVVTGPYGSITRDSYFELLIQCRYDGTTVEALVIEVGLIPQPKPVAAPGHLHVELRLGSGQCFTKGCVEEEEAYSSFYNDADYPVRKVLGDPVYAEVCMLDRTDPNLVLTLGRCWATSEPYPHSLPQWDLLIDGCPYRDDRYLTTLLPVGPLSGYKFPTHHKRFAFRMFRFVGNSGPNTGKPESKTPDNMTPLQEKLFIHCDVTICQPTLGNNCEPRCFRKRREIAGSLKQDFRAETPVSSSKELVIVERSTEGQHPKRIFSL